MKFDTQKNRSILWILFDLVWRGVEKEKVLAGIKQKRLLVKGWLFVAPKKRRSKSKTMPKKAENRAFLALLLAGVLIHYPLPNEENYN